ncbi:MAG: hypothetical protein H0X62_02225 [Bacteroidetes bacterium]|nr:hypothetical protein [Bacteroidota bacterium]
MWVHFEFLTNTGIFVKTQLDYLKYAAAYNNGSMQADGSLGRVFVKIKMKKY